MTRVVDVRALPLSRRRGFSKTKLSQALDEAGIEYVHFRGAGNPYRQLREDIEHCLGLFRAHLDEHPDVVEQLDKLTARKTTALLCVEADPACCHRSILVERMAEHGVPLRVQHL